MSDTLLSQLDRDLGLEKPCDLNIFWSLAFAADRNRAQRQVAEVLRARYTPGGSIRRTYRECAAFWGISETRAENIVKRALQRMRHPQYLSQYAGNGNGGQR